MSKDELLDLVNEKDEVIGEVWMSEAHNNSSIIHREVAISVFHKRGDVLIQRRSMIKTNDPGKWVITAAGHIGAGENPKDAVERELYEELGFKVDAIFYKKIFEKRVGCPGTKEARFFWIYYSIVDKKPNFKIDKREVIDAKWISPNKLVAFSKKNNWNINGLSHKIILEMHQKFFERKNED